MPWFWINKSIVLEISTIASSIYVCVRKTERDRVRQREKDRDRQRKRETQRGGTGTEREILRQRKKEIYFIFLPFAMVLDQ